MDILIKSFMPDILNALILIAFSILAAFCVGLSATRKWGGSKVKNNLGFIGITLAFSVLCICFFGLSAITVRGIILCLILLFASFLSQSNIYLSTSVGVFFVQRREICGMYVGRSISASTISFESSLKPSSPFGRYPPMAKWD